jgi:two-component system NtrC family sensor kinase
MLSILIADDSSAVLRILERIFTRAGFNVATAPDGEEALALLHSNQFDILICDIMMPRMDGRQLCQHLRDQGPYLPEHVYIMTSHSEGAMRRWVDDIPGAKLIEKPVGPKKLLRLVRQYLETEEGMGSPEQCN